MDNVTPFPKAFKPHVVPGAQRASMRSLAELAKSHGDSFDKALDKSESLKRFFACETLRAELAAQVVGLAEHCYSLSDKAKSYSEIATCANLRTVAGDLEMIAAILGPPPTETA